MKKLILSLLLVLLTMVTPGHVQGGGGDGFAPPILPMDLSRPEPLPPGIPEVAEYSIGGGCSGLCGIIGLPLPDSPFFEESSTAFLPTGGCYPECKSDRDPLEQFVGCGFRATPQSTLIEPDGSRVSYAPVGQDLAAGRGYSRGGQADPEVLGCWYYLPPSGYGIPLGNYQLLLEGPEGIARKDFRVTYPNQPTLALMAGDKTVPGFTNQEVKILMGFQPNQMVHLLFYVDREEDSGSAKFLASRTVQLDSAGAAVIGVRTSKSAGFTARGVHMRVTLPGIRSDSPLSILDTYVFAVNSHDYQTAYGLFLSPQGSYQAFANGYSDTARIGGSWGPFIWDMEPSYPDVAAGISGRLSAVLVGYRNDGNIESYRGCYFLRLAKDGWKIEDANFQSLFLREPTNSEVANFTNQACQRAL